MRKDRIVIKNQELPVYSLNTVIVGSGAAGLNAADRLFGFGQKDIALVTENMKTGTSRNTGSDKQTYYKLSLSGHTKDSVAELAMTFFNGQCVDGDIALIEAALSSRCFYRLIELGVDFPVNRYGEYVGYKTDHDCFCRATSAGPYTSRQMTELLEYRIKQNKIPIYDKLQVISVLTADGTAVGLLCINLDLQSSYKEQFVLFNCKNIIYATGGPAGIYSDSAYPLGHYGSTGIAFEAGVIGKNLTEWQYGLASISPRWDVSGTYMQSLPRFISVDEHGNEHEFLFDYYKDRNECISNVFLKGYEWPFDVGKIQNGSSMIDILVYVETQINGHKVYLDFRNNPQDTDINFNALCSEARLYLHNADAEFGKPIDRLRHMNMPAYEYFLNNGVDLEKEPLQIALCVQHNNGGLSINQWWETNIQGFFAVGEVSASHGVYRPGGSALNAGQVGSTRAAQLIARHRSGMPPTVQQFYSLVKTLVNKKLSLGHKLIDAYDNVDEYWKDAAGKMSRFGATMRKKEDIRRCIDEIQKLLNQFPESVKTTRNRLHRAFRLYDVLLCQLVYFSAMEDYIEHKGKSRGSALYYQANGEFLCDGFPEEFRYNLDNGEKGAEIQEVLYHGGMCRFMWRPVRPIPRDDYFFENVWREYRKNKSIIDYI